MPDIEELSGRVAARRRELEAKAVEKRILTETQTELEAELVRLHDDVDAYERATIVLNSIGETKQLTVQNAIEELVTRALRSIFDDTLSFRIVQDVKARRAEVRFVVRTELSNGRVVDTDVMDARGGGLATTIGFLLRLVIMLLRSDTRTDNFLVLDETFAMVSAEYLPALREFIRKIVDKTGVQILMVTHQPEFAEAADKVYRMTNVDGRSGVKEQM